MEMKFEVRVTHCGGERLPVEVKAPGETYGKAASEITNAALRYMALQRNQLPAPTRVGYQREITYKPYVPPWDRV